MNQAYGLSVPKWFPGGDPAYAPGKRFPQESAPTGWKWKTAQPGVSELTPRPRARWLPVAAVGAVGTVGLVSILAKLALPVVLIVVLLRLSKRGRR